MLGIFALKKGLNSPVHLETASFATTFVFPAKKEKKKLWFVCALDTYIVHPSHIQIWAHREQTKAHTEVVLQQQSKLKSEDKSESVPKVLFI